MALLLAAPALAQLEIQQAKIGSENQHRVAGVATSLVIRNPTDQDYHNIQLSHDAESNLKSLSNPDMFVQIFNDNEIIINSKKTIWNSEYEFHHGEKANEFIVKEFNVTELNDINYIKNIIMKISHNDIQFKYLGIKPNTIVKIQRRPVIPGLIVKNDIIFAWIF